MAMNLGDILVSVRSDTSQLVAGFNRAETAVNKTTKQMSYAVKGLIGAFVGLNTLDIAKNFTKQMDMITQSNNKLLLSTKNTNDFITAQKELFRVAQQTNQGYSETVDLYSNLAISMESMGKSQAEVIRTVETVNKAIAISGSNAQQSAAAVLQLGQAFGSGKLSGDELGSLTENSKGLVKAIADGLGVAVGDLKELGSQGKITSELLSKSLAKSAEDVDAKFGSMTKSTSQGFNNLSNSMSVMAGQFGNAIGFGDDFAGTLFKISNYLDTNKDDIIKYGIITTATISKVVDNFLLLGVDIKNTAELLLDSVGIMAFGALKSVSNVLLEVTKSLNDLGLSSNETLSNAQSLFNFADKGYTNFTKSAVNNIEDMDRAYLKANVSLDDRIKSMEKEYIFQKEKAKNPPLVEASKKETDALKEKEKAVKDAQDRIKDLTKEATELTISEVDKVNAKYMEMYEVIKNTFNPEQLNTFNKRWQEDIEKVNGTLDSQKEKQDLVNQALESSTSEYDKIIAKYVQMYDAVQGNPLWDTEKQNEFFNNLNKDLDNLEKKLDFTATIELDTIGDDKSIQRIEKSFQDLNKATKHYEENRAKIKKGSEDEAKNEEMFRKDQMNGYINMAGALGSMFEQGSKEAATFQAAQLSLALVEGTRAILTSGTGDPYTAIPRMAAMGIMVKSLLGNIGVALGMSKVSETTSSDSMSSLKANTGTGTVLGDPTKQSESIAKAMGILEDFAEPQFEVLESMNKYLETIANSIGGVSRLLIQSGQYGKAFGAGFAPTATDTGWKGLGVSYQGIGDKITNKVEDLFSSVLGDTVGGITGKLFTLPTKIMDKALGSIIGGIFGKTSTTSSTKLTDSGIFFADQLLTNARDEIYGSMYQTIQKKTTTTKKSWFGSSTSTKKKISTSMYDMEGNTELERQFSLILDSMYGSTFEASKALDFTSKEITSTLDNFVVSIGKISLNGLSGDQIQDRLKSVFGAIGDNLAKTAFPLLIGFQQVGEGMYTTMTRVATGMEEARFYIDRLGTASVKYTDILNQQGVVGFEALAQSIIKADEATYGLNNGVVQMIENMSSTTDELYNTYLTFGNIRDILQVTNQNASNLSSSMILGAGSISALESGTKSYMENFLSDNERLNIQLARLSDEFKNAGYSMPKTRQGFIDLVKSIDTSTESGAKAYGRLIGLSDSYNTTISEIEDNLSKLINTFSSLGDSVSQTIATLAGANTDSVSATNQIKSFWEKRKEIDNLLALNGNLTQDQQSKLSKLVGEVNSLATNIQGNSSSSSNITNELISNLTGLQNSLNLENQILSVNIVGVASNVALIENIAGISANVPTLTNNTSNYVTSDILSTEIKQILTTIKDNLSTYPQRTYDLLDDVINGNQRVKVQTI